MAAVTVDATAFTGPDARSDANASALATLSVAASDDTTAHVIIGHFSHSGTVGDPVDVEAHASDHGAGNALASARTKVQAGAGTIAAVFGGSLTDVASANNWGNGAAIAFAKTTASALAEIGGSVHIDGDILVVANARDWTGDAASADASLTLRAAGFINGVITVTGDIAIIANAENAVDGNAISRAALDVIASGSNEIVQLGNVLVDASASEQAIGLASALAVRNIQTPLPSLSGTSFSGVREIRIGSLVDRASAINFGGGTVRALASANLQAGGALHVGGGIRDAANALLLSGGAMTDAIASACAVLAVLSSGDITIAGDIEASGHAAGAAVDVARANTVITANLTSGSVFVNGQITGFATASGGSNHASAVLKMDAHGITSGGELGLGDPIMRARAGSAVAEWLVDSSGTAASGGAFVRVNIPPGF